jgi:Protein of unknown function (DUF1207)
MLEGTGKWLAWLFAATLYGVAAPAARAQWSVPSRTESADARPALVARDAADGPPPASLHRLRNVSQLVTSPLGPGHSEPPLVRAPQLEPASESPWHWQFLPVGLIYRSYLAGEKEPRFGSSFLHQPGEGWFWEAQVGGRVGIVRYGDDDPIAPRGFQVDLEGGAFPRLNLRHAEDVDAVDFRIGLPLTWRLGNWAIKLGYAHVSSHVGDEFLIRNPGFQRINYVRDSVVLGAVYHATNAFRLYGEIGYAFHLSGGAKPVELQFGAEYSPLYVLSSPFAAVNGHLREEMNFSGGLNVMAGWQWRGPANGRLLRIGLQYFNGKSMQYSFFSESEQLLGLGAWLDF